MAATIKTRQDIETMKKSCVLAAEVLDFIEPHVKAGVSTNQLNDLCHNFIIEAGAIPSPLNYKGFPKSICTSVNSVVCHGIPSDLILKDGDIVNLDITTFLEDFHGDTSKTFIIGKASRTARDLVQRTEEAMWQGIRAIRPGGHIGDIGAAIEKFVTSFGYSIVEEYCGHGIGRKFHEDPHVPHYGEVGQGPLIKPGMVFTVEPMINLGKNEIFLWDDDWTVETKDKKLSAQFEHTIAVSEDRVEVLTLSPSSKIDPVVWKKS